MTHRGSPLCLTIRARAVAGWIRWGVFIQAALFVAVFFALMTRRHDAFHTFALDLGKFDQAIWNTLHGRFLFTTLQNYTILGNHFSPLMALLSPLFLIWSDVRVLFLVQMVGLGVSGVFLWMMVHEKYPTMAPWFSLAYYLNPALHEVALVEFRRVTLAMPFLALALYALLKRKRWLMALGLGLALLCKEDIALIVFMVGAYLVVFERDWKWGGALLLLGGVWAVLVTFWVIPMLHLAKDTSGGLYPQLNSMGLEGNSYSEIALNLLHDPLVLVRRMGDPPALRALFRVFLPLGFVLPLLAADWLLVAVPTLSYMLMSAAPGMHRLEDWYMAPILPVVFAAIAVGLSRRSARVAGWLTGVLVASTLVGYALYSYAPLGGYYDPALYEVTEHARLAARAVQAVPAAAAVAAQDPYVPHLTHREHIYLYPWISIDPQEIDYVLLDRKASPYPLQPPRMNSVIDNMIADPAQVIDLEADGIYLFHQRGEPLPSFAVDRIAEETMRLDRVEVAIQGVDGVFHAVSEQPFEIRGGDQVRVSLYWEAVADCRAERTVSVRIAPIDPASGVRGPLVAVHDGWPGGGKKPTSWWRKGWQIRDVHYMSVSPAVPPGTASLDLLLYDSFNQAQVFFDGSDGVLRLCDVILVP